MQVIGRCVESTHMKQYVILQDLSTQLIHKMGNNSKSFHQKFCQCRHCGHLVRTDKCLYGQISVPPCLWTFRPLSADMMRMSATDVHLISCWRLHNVMDVHTDAEYWNAMSIRTSVFAYNLSAQMSAFPFLTNSMQAQTSIWTCVPIVRNRTDIQSARSLYGNCSFSGHFRYG